MAKHERGLRFQPTGGSRAPQIPTGKKQRLSIERLANDGRGIAFLDGRTWFVTGALAGEEVEARVLGAHGKVVEARTERVFQASELRRPMPCAHAGRCGGCSVQHLPHDEQLALKQRMLAEQLSRVAGVQPDEWAAPPIPEDCGSTSVSTACMAIAASMAEPPLRRISRPASAASLAGSVFCDSVYRVTIIWSRATSWLTSARREIWL